MRWRGAASLRPLTGISNPEHRALFKLASGHVNRRANEDPDHLLEKAAPFKDQRDRISSLLAYVDPSEPLDGVRRTAVRRSIGPPVRLPHDAL